MKPMLAHVFEDHRWIGGPCWLQPKFNGVRALAQNGCFQSRDELPWNNGVLDHIGQPLKEMFGPDVVLDGELYVHGWTLQEINGAIAINRHEPNEKTLQVSYYVFDQVKFNTPFFTRFQEIEGTIRAANNPAIHAATTVAPPNREWVEEFYAKFIAEGYEGIMYRIGLCLYTQPKQPKEHAPGFLSDKNNRTWHLLKRKSWMDDEFEWGTIQEGEGKQAGMLGAFGCTTKDGVNFYVGSGLTDAERIEYWNNPPNGKKIKVKFLTYTLDGRPFNPTIEAIV